MKQHLIIKTNRSFGQRIVAVGIVIIGVLFWLISSPDYIPASYQMPYTVTVSTANTEISGLGVIYPKDRNIISAPVSGYVKDLHLRLGQKISQGDVLLKLVNEELEQEYANSLYDYQNVQASVAIKQAELQERSFQLQSQLKRAEAEFHKQKLELEAKRTLSASGVVSSIQFRQAELSTSQAEAESGLLQKQLDNFEHSKTQQTQALQGQLEAAKHRNMYLKERLSQLTFYAEQDAIISKLELSRGQSVQQGQQLLEWIEQSKLVALINLPQHTATQIKPGLSAKVNTPFGPVSGKVSYINPVVKSGAYQVELQLEQHQLPLAVDQDIEAIIYTEETKTRLVVNKPFGFKHDSWKVFLKQGNTAKLITLSVTQQDDSVLFLDNSLSAGDTLWFVPAQLANGDELRIPDAS